MKVMCIVGTRPELIKMSRVINEFDKYTDLTLVHTGQNYDYELNQVFFEDLNIRQPDYFLNAVGKNVGSTIGNVIDKTYGLIEEINPDALLLYGDTNSCLSVIAAKRQKIPIFHMEAGNRCFDERVPEELNRKVVDHLSDINLVLTDHARRYLINEGIKPETIIKTGSHMEEVLIHHKDQIKSSNILNELNLETDKYFLVSAHREENVDSIENLKELLITMNDLASKYNVPIIVSTHPRTENTLKKLNTYKSDPKIKFLKPFGFFDYIKLQQNALCVISDSGTITEEASLLNLKAITIRNTHERPEGMDAGTIIMSGLKSKNVIDSINIIISQNKNKLNLGQIEDYKKSNVSKQILRIVFSYVEYINSNVWKKEN
tara:strand:- start:9 stop:1133 length:1125 start_codon:yes stop_codon:yes gene_type:complete